MIHCTLKELAVMVDGQIEANYQDITIQGVTIDSRKIEKGNLFIPLRGEKTDGHEYVPQAILDGAFASLWEKEADEPPANTPVIIVEDALAALQCMAEHYRQQVKTTVIGITGSNGKTTTKDIAASIISQKYKVHKTQGNYNNHIGLPLTILAAPEDTQVLILEMGMSSRGEIAFLSNLARPDIAVITNIGESHLLDLGSREAIAEAKLEIIQGLQENGTLIFHGDEPLLVGNISKLTPPKTTVYSFGRGSTNAYFSEMIHTGEEGTDFALNADGETHKFHLPILGAHNVLNALAAIACGRALHIDWKTINKGLGEAKLSNMRMEVTLGAKGEKIINDAYNASPTSMKAAIELVASLKGFNRKILVLGDMLELGIAEEEYHLKTGEFIGEKDVDLVLTYGKLGQKIAEGARKSLPQQKVHSFIEKEELKNFLLNNTEANDLLLVKASRGMKLEEIVRALQ